MKSNENGLFEKDLTLLNKPVFLHHEHDKSNRYEDVLFLLC
ncbi:hypothetical protein EDO6_04997 [Paenibacillus xylanexedens]|nr:hypothetical protein EDO6_04997 [Paenibacillus xylanexedens]